MEHIQNTKNSTNQGDTCIESSSSAPPDPELKQRSLKILEGGLCKESITAQAPVSIGHSTRQLGLDQVSSGPAQTNWLHNAIYIGLLFTPK